MINISCDKTEEGVGTAPFSEIWCLDFEFRTDPGERPWPVCMVAEELKTWRVLRLWRDDLLACSRALRLSMLARTP